MSFLDFFRTKQVAVTPEPEEQRSVTYGGPVVSNWDSAFGAGALVDKLSVVYGCVNLRASTIASLPIQLNRKLARGHEAAVDHPYYRLITQTPNQYNTTYTFWHWAITQLDLFGNAYIQKIRKGSGEVVEMIPLNPQSVEIEIREDGLPYYKMVLVDVQNKGFTQEFTSEQIIHLKGYSRNGVYGLSVIDTFRTLFNGYSELENAGTQIAKNAAKPSGIVKHPPNTKAEELEKLKTGWQNGFNGTNSGKTAWLPTTFEVTGVPSSLTAEQAQYIDQKQFSAIRIVCDIFGCPAHRFNLNNSPTYASVEETNRAFVNWTLGPVITNIEQQLQKQLLDETEDVYVVFDTKGLMRGDLKSRIEYYRFALEHGVLTTNQVNEMEDTGLFITPVNGGDDYIRPLNFGVIGKPVPQQTTNSGSISTP